MHIMGGILPPLFTNRTARMRPHIQFLQFPHLDANPTPLKMYYSRDSPDPQHLGTVAKGWQVRKAPSAGRFFYLWMAIYEKDKD